MVDALRLQAAAMQPLRQFEHILQELRSVGG